MLTFKQYCNEAYISIGLNSDHERYREMFRDQMHNMLRLSYVKINGYGGLGSGSKAESDAIHNDISNSIIKAVRRGSELTAIILYKQKYGRKSIAVATNGTPKGKQDLLLILKEDQVS